MNECALRFSIRHFIQEGHEQDPGVFSDTDRSLIHKIRAACPELNGWGDQAIAEAWGSYSQDVYLVSWLEESQVTIEHGEMTEFLGYIHWHDINGLPRWGITPEELADFGKANDINQVRN